MLNPHRRSLLVSAVVAIFVYILFCHQEKKSQQVEKSLNLPEDVNDLSSLRMRKKAGFQPVSSYKIVADEESHNQQIFKVGVEKSQPVSEKNIYNLPGRHLLSWFEHGKWTTQGDILVDEMSFEIGGGDSETGIVKLQPVRYWKDGIIPYEFNESLKTSEILAAMHEIADKTSVKFIEKDDEDDYVSVIASESDQNICQSHLGRKGGRQEIVLHQSCTRGQILHELMHTLGFVHEHSREDRDQYIEIYWENIQTNQLNQFQKIVSEVSMPVDTVFDFDSILLYPVTAYSNIGKITIAKKGGSAFSANRRSLSNLDIQRINLLYGSVSKDLE